MKRFLSIVAAAAVVLAFAGSAPAQDPKDKNPPAKDKPEKAVPPTAPAKDAKADKDSKADKDKTPPPAADSSKAKDEATPYYPLQVGSSWQYKIGDNVYTLKVTKFEKRGDLNCARVEQLVDDKVIAFEHIAVTKDGVVRVAYDDKLASPPLLFLKLPVKKDMTWTVDSVVGKVDKAPGERVAGTFKEGEVAKVMLPARFYTNVVTTTTSDLNVAGQKLSFTYYFAKDVGLIKQEVEIGDTKVIIELMKYEPGAPSKL